MYTAMIGRFFLRTWDGLIRGKWLRSPITLFLLAAVLLVGIGIAIHEKGRGDYTKLKSELHAPASVPEPTAPQPGGQNAITLTREQRTGAISPEFLSVTMLPGRSMNILQIKAYLPGKGAVPLLASPSMAEAAHAMTGIDEDAEGEASLKMGAAFELPWAGRIFGTPMPGGLSVLANWNGHGIALPALATEGSAKNDGSSEGGLFLRRAASSAQPSTMLDGGVAEASFDAGDFNGHWPSTTQVKTSVILRATTIDLTVTATNTGSEPEPMGIGWNPRFLIPDGDRAKATIRIPSETEIETDHTSGVPTGRLIPAKQGSALAAKGGVPLGSQGWNNTYVHLKSGMLSDGAETELSDPALQFGLRLTALSSSIKAIHLSAPVGKPFVTINPQTNFDDPLGREWVDVGDDRSVTVLQPGESLQWKVRLELFSTSGETAPPR